MALPKWITPAGNLGIVPELEYYEFSLDAYDASGGALSYFLVSGRLPLGLQIISTGKITGIPVSELGRDQNVTYTFTIRAQNTVTSYITDRTFNLTITNVAPPIISTPPRNSYLGLYLDGTSIDIQLKAIEFLPGAELVWTVKSGDLPPGLILTTTGMLSGYLEPIASIAPGTQPNWDETTWNHLGWDFPLYAIKKTFDFVIQVFDGVNYDATSYSLEVYPRSYLTADNDGLKVDADTLGGGIPLSIDYGNKHNPIITSTQINLPSARESSYFSFQIEARDLDGDILNYSIPALVTGGFDEQAFSNTAISYPYVATTISNNKLSSGIFPKALVITATSATFVGNIANVTVVSSSGNSYIGIMTVTSVTEGMISVGQDISAGGIITGTYITSFISNIGGVYTYQVSIPQTLTTTVISTVSDTRTSISVLDPTDVEFLPGDVLKVLNSENHWQLATVTSEVTVRLTGNTVVSAASGQYLTQTSSLANATISNVSSTIGTIELHGNIWTGYINTILPTYQITFSGNIFGNVGEYITQSSSGANARITSNVSSSTANIIYVSGDFTAGSGNIKIHAANVDVYPTEVIKDIQNIVLNANVGDYITQVGYSGNARITSNISDAISIPVIFDNTDFNPLSGNIKINGVDARVWITNLVEYSNPFGMGAQIGQYITQASTGANVKVIGNVINGTVFPVQFLSNTFALGSGNIKLNGANVNAYPTQISANTDIIATYNNSSTFDINSTLLTATPAINGTNLTSGKITSILSVGVTVGALATEGTVGFDSSKYDQGVLDLPAGLILNTASGWITGRLPTQTLNQIDYQFEIIAYKKDDPTYQDNKLLTLVILGELNNRIDWVTASDLGTLETGKVSDLFVYAISALGKTLFYELAANSYQRLPQGLALTLSGLVSGRVSFEVFGIDNGLTTLDNQSTTFDFTFTFTVTARDANNTVSSNRTFTVTLRQFDKIPYENLYLKALPTRDQRTSFEQLISDRTIFPLDKIYRNDDPWFGLAKSLRSLFLAGLSPTTLVEYVQAASKNHFKKRLTFGDIKTAQVLDDNFNIKYEVVYIEVLDENTTAQGDGPADIQYPKIVNPYYDTDGNSYTIAYPNAFEDMGNVMVQSITYQDKGVLPDWMTSRQTNSRQLGFVHAAVLAYTKPGESSLIAYRLQQRNFNFNTIDFTVDRYQLDNAYTANYDIAANAFITSTETTFDRYPSLTGIFNVVGTVDYAISIPYEQINDHLVGDIKALGGMDGILNFKDGDTLVFSQQEFIINQVTSPDYNNGWSDVIVLWDNGDWAYGTSDDTGDDDVLTPNDPTLTPPNLGPYDYSPGEKWDYAIYVPGYNEHLLDPSVPNKRIGIWSINIDTDKIVTLSFIQEINYYETLYVRNGFTCGGTNIYYDPLVKVGNLVPNYSIIPQEIKTASTKFDGGGTRFYDNRDSYIVPEQGDKYIKFTKTGVFT